MRSGGWGSGQARQVSASVAGLLTTRGKKVDVSRSLPSTLPGQFSVGGSAAATGSVSAGTSSGVTDRVGTPFSRRDWPQPGDPVGVKVTDGVNSHQVFTGNVDGTDSSFGSPDVSVKLVDHTDRLSTQVSHNAVFRTMPPLATNGTERPRMTGLTSAYVTTLLAREAGYFMTPPRAGFTNISAPLTGSTWPERGLLRSSGQHDDYEQYNRFQPGFMNIDGDVYGHFMHAVYENDPYATFWDGGITTSRPMTITMGVGPSQPTSSYVAARWPLGTEARLAVTSGRDIALQRRWTDGSINNILVLDGAKSKGWRRVVVKIQRVSDTSPLADVTIITDTGVSTSTRYQVPQEWFAGSYNTVRVYAPPECYVNGVQVSFNQGDHPAVSFAPTFTAEIDYISSLEVIPALMSESVGELLNGQAEAECAALWLDEDGRLRWHGRRKLMEQSVRATLTSSDVADAQITMDAQDVRSKVSVKYEAWETSVATRSRIVVHEGSKNEYDVSDPGEVTIINPPSDEQWVQVDTTPAEIAGGEGVNRFNKGEGSWVGYTVLGPDGDEFSYSDWTRTTWSFAPIGPGAWKYKFNVTRLPSTADRVKTATRSEDTTDLKASYRGLGLPLLRAMGKATSTDADYTSTVRGPSGAPELVHDVGWFIQHDTRIQGVADFIATELTTPLPRISGLQVLPDPRIQLGDMIRVRETARTGLEIVGVVTGVSQSVGPGEHSMSLDLMVKTVVASSVTFSEFDAWYAGKTIGEVDATFNGDSFAQHDAKPLRQ